MKMMMTFRPYIGHYQVKCKIKTMNIYACEKCKKICRCKRTIKTYKEKKLFKKLIKNLSTNSRFARCRHLTTTTRIPFVFSLLFKF